MYPKIAVLRELSKKVIKWFSETQGKKRIYNADLQETTLEFFATTTQHC